MQIHSLFTGVANTHIITLERGVIVVDAGMPHMTGRILGKIRTLGYSAQDVRLILLTHGHVDHAGSAAALKRATGAPIALHPGDIPLVATRDLKFPPGRTALSQAITRMVPLFGWAMPLDTFTPDVLLEDGQRLDEYGLDARVLHTPGHSDGSVSIACADGSMFVGDAILNLVHVSFPLWWHDERAAHASACRIYACEPRISYSGHGRPFDLNELETFIGNHCDQAG